MPHSGRAGVAGVLSTAQEATRPMPDVRLMTLDPGHFHAALVQKEMYPGVAPRVDVYAPLGPDLVEHLKRIDSLQPPRPSIRRPGGRRSTPSPDYFERMLREHPGNVVVLSGRNRGKIDRIVASVERRAQRAGRQALDSEVGGPAEARSGAGRGRQARRRGLRHHDRAVRDDLDPAARARQRSRHVRRDGARAPRPSPASTWRASTT